MAQVQSGADQVQLAYTKHKQGFNADVAVVVVRGKRFAIEFKKRGKFMLTRREAMSYVSKSRMWGLAHMDNSPVLSVVEISDQLSENLDGTSGSAGGPGDGGDAKPKLAEMNYNDLLSMAQGLGLEVVSGQVKKAELIKLIEEKQANA